MDRVVVLEERTSAGEAVVTAFGRQGIDVSRMNRDADVAAAISDDIYLLVILCPWTIEGADLNALRYLTTSFPDTRIVPALTTPSLNMTLTAIRLGAFDVLTLPSTADAVKDLLDRARLRRQEAALRRLETFGELSRWLAHEVRNPLSCIVNSAQLLREESSLPAITRRRLKIIIEEGDRLEQYLRRMTELGRSTQGVRLPTSLNAVTERVLARAQSQFQRQGIQLERRFDPRVPKMPLDVAQMEKAVSRLLANAVAAMPTGGTTTVVTRYRPDEKMIELEITDTDLEAGPERERQLSGKIESSRFKEAGLGLVAALQTFVEHGGDVSFRTRPGLGCSIVAQLSSNGQAEQS